MTVNQPITAHFDPRVLLDQAHQARERAYAPYSHYKVGAALLGRSGRIYTGCNVENAVYPLSTCAERTAVVKAVSEGEREFVAIAVVTENGGTPCGACRQTLREFAEDLVILIGDATGHYRQTTLRQLLPESFSAADLAPVFPEPPCPIRHL
ncbi:MAG: cytidine deaminase [Thermoflexales bacterium]|nr:cytidine deaminase [Thermoflexales bacterium]